MTERIAWFDCSAGVAGDMVLASLVDAGADRVAVMDAWGALGVDGFAATWERVQRCGIASLWTNIVVDDHHDHPHRPAAHVLDLIGTAELPARVRDRALAVYRALAEVEGRVHGIEPDAVELHEVGALDSVLDVVGACAAMESLGIDRIAASSIAIGHGTVETAHGTLPNPVPAVTLLLARAQASTTPVDTTMELATPTGVALVTVLGDTFGAPPAMTVEAVGFGAGTADPDGRPNVVQTVIGARHDRRPDDGRPCRLIEANVDDVTGEVLAHTISRLLDAGAFDAWATPIVMKKGRPAHTVHALVDDARFDAVRATLVDETGTLGVRAVAVERWPQRRDERTIDLGGHAIRVKVSAGRVKVEHDDALAAANALGRPLRDVLREAEHLARST